MLIWSFKLNNSEIITTMMEMWNVILLHLYHGVRSNIIFSDHKRTWHCFYFHLLYSPLLLSLLLPPLLLFSLLSFCSVTQCSHAAQAVLRSSGFTGMCHLSIVWLCVTIHDRQWVFGMPISLLMHLKCGNMYFFNNSAKYFF